MNVSLKVKQLLPGIQDMRIRYNKVITHSEMKRPPGCGSVDRFPGVFSGLPIRPRCHSLGQAIG